MGWVMTSVRHLRNNLFGNVILSRFPIAHHSQYDLSWRTCEPRACQRADLDIGAAQPLHIYNVHLGTAVLERRYQAKRLAAFVHDRRILGPKIILGDFNEWLRGLATATLSSLFESIDIYAHLKRRRTYPGIFPVLHLDHIYYEGRVEVRGHEAEPLSPGAYRVRSPAARRRPSDRVRLGRVRPGGQPTSTNHEHRCAPSVLTP